MSKLYKNKVTNEFGFTISYVRSQYSNAILPTDVRRYKDFEGYNTVAQPAYNVLLQGVREIAPAVIDGVLTQRWEVYSLSAQEAQDARAAKVAAVQLDYDARLMQYFNQKAGERNYRTFESCSLRAGYPGPFQAEGQAFAQWMDACNIACYGLLAARVPLVMQGDISAIPTWQQVVDALPVLIWPAPVV